jgi:hypothetical protein
MARSTYIYTVQWFRPSFDGPATIGTFTVKHEMVSAVQHAVNIGVVNPKDLTIYRHIDGGFGLVVAERGNGIDVSEQFDWGTRP